MKKIIIVYVTLIVNIFGACLEVGVTSGQTCSGNTIHIDNITKAFSDMEISSTNNLLDIPIYLYSDTDKSVTMQLSLSNLTKGTESIATEYYFLNSNKSTSVTISNDTPFTLLNTGTAGTSPRDGNTIVGYIRLKVPSVSALQTAGDYSLSSSTQVTLNAVGSDIDTLTATTTVPYVTQVSFSDNVSSKTNGESFVTSNVDLGQLTIGSTNSKVVDVYLKNNTNNDVTMSFTPVSLHHVDDSSYKIDMTYIYTNISNVTTTITNNTAFTLKNGKNSGSKVGTMSFQTEAITQYMLAGTYEASMTVTIQAR